MIQVLLAGLLLAVSQPQADKYALIWSNGDRTGLIKESSIARHDDVVTFSSVLIDRQSRTSNVFSGSYDYSVGLYDLKCSTHEERIRWVKWFNVSGALQFQIDHPTPWKAVSQNTADVIHLCVEKAPRMDFVTVQQALERLRNGRQPQVGTHR